MGKLDGGGVPVHRVLARPVLVSRKLIVPSPATAACGFPRLLSVLVQPSVNESPAVLATHTFSVVISGVYAESAHLYVHVAPAGCGSQLPAAAGPAAASAAPQTASVRRARRICSGYAGPRRNVTP